jgi:hypothetical protein
MLTLTFLEERAKRGDPVAFDRILARVPDVPPLPGDEIEGEMAAKGPQALAPAGGDETQSWIEAQS